MSFSKWIRTLHRWGSVIIALPLLVVLATGTLLLLKKQLSWVQPPTQLGSGVELALGFDEILAVCRTVPEADIEDWGDVERIDVRPTARLLKVRAANRWEIQIDGGSGEVLQTAYRRSDLIESLHDGTFIHDKVKLFIFLPSALILFGLWCTGLYLLALPYLSRRKRKTRSA